MNSADALCELAEKVNMVEKEINNLKRFVFSQEDIDELNAVLCDIRKGVDALEKKNQ